MLLDLTGTVVSIREPGRDWPSAFPILTFVGDASSSAQRQEWQYKAKLKRITLSNGAAKLYAEEAKMYINKKTVAVILGMQHQVSRSVARWCLSHSNDQHHRLPDVLAAVGAVQPGEIVFGREASRMARRYVQQIKEDGEHLRGLGIDIQGDLLHYRRQRGTVFIEGSSDGGDEGQEERLGSGSGPNVEPKTPVVEPKTPVVEPKTPVS